MARGSARADEAFDPVVDFLEHFDVIEDPRQRAKCSIRSMKCCWRVCSACSPARSPTRVPTTSWRGKATRKACVRIASFASPNRRRAALPTRSSAATKSWSTATAGSIPDHLGDGRYRLVAGTPQLAGARRGSPGLAGARQQRHGRNRAREPLLYRLGRRRRRSPGPSHAKALEHRERAPLGDGHGGQRRRMPDPKADCSRQLHHRETHGNQPVAPIPRQGPPARKSARRCLG